MFGATRLGPAPQVQGTAFGGSAGAAALEQNRALQARSMFRRQQEEEQQRQLQARQGQSALAQALAAQAAGQGPSVARNQLTAAMDANQRQAMSMAAGARGNTALAQRQAMMAGSQANLQAGTQMAALRSQEQMGAQQSLAALLGQQRGMDLGAMQFAGGQGMSMEQMRQAQLGMTTQNMQGAALANQQALQQQQLAQAKLDDEAAGRDRASVGQLIGASASLLPLLASDERAKTDIKNASGDVASLLAQIAPKSYRYREPDKHGEGDQYGLLAQDLEKSDMGKAMVREVGGTKHVDVSRAAMAALVAVAEQARRLDRLEKGAR